MGERILSKESTEPDLCFRKVTDGLVESGLEMTGIYCTYSLDQKVYRLFIRTALAYLKGVQEIE